MAVQIPISTKLIDGGKGFDDAAKAARQAAREAQQLAREQERAAKAATAAALASTRAQISEHRKVLSLTAKLDKDLAGPKASFQDQLKNAVGGQMLAVNALQGLVGGLKDFGVESIQAAAAADRLGRATDSMAMGFGTSGAAITASIQQASDYTINQMDAMQAANQAMLLGVAKTPEEFDRLSKVAVALGRAMGQDATKSIEDLTIGMGRQSKLILDNLGLMVDAETANEKYAASIGKTASELTDAEKKQAFINEALSQGERKMATLGDQALDAAGKVERLTARWADFQIESGRAISSMGQSTGALDLLNSAVDGMIAGAQGWQTAAKNADLLSDSLDRMNKGTWLQKLEQIPIVGSQIKGLDFWGSMLFRHDEFQKAVTETGQEMEALRQKQEDAAKAAADQAAAAAKAEELRRRLERVNQVRRGFAGDLIDITEQAAADTQATWDDYFKEEAGAWSDHQDNVAKIQADSAKEQQRIQQDLAKTLTAIDKDLTKDLAKLDKDYARERSKAERDGARQIARMEQDAAREERRTQRQRQIDAKADERLFQYDMRQLAAEGEFNQIQQAMERREIEKRIEAEKTTEEDRARQEDSRVQVQRAREDLQIRLAEMEEERNLRREELIARAEEERVMAQERAAEEEARRQEELAQALADEQANYQERLESLRQHRDEKLAAIEEQKQANLAKLGEELAETKDLTRSEMEALIPVAQALGEDVGAAFAGGLNDGFARNARINEMIGDQTSGPASFQPGSRPGFQNQSRTPVSTFGPRTTTTLGTPFAGFTQGIRGFVVPPGFNNDDYLVGLTSGERVDVTPAGQRGRSETPITVNVNGVGGNDLAGIIRRKVEEGVNEYHSNVIVPWSQG